MSRILETIGIHAMTNREAIIEELEAMSDTDFDRFIKNVAGIGDHICEILCTKCKAKHDGHPPCEFDDNADCGEFDQVRWWSQPNTEDLNIKEAMP